MHENNSCLSKATGLKAALKTKDYFGKVTKHFLEHLILSCQQ